MFFQAGWFVMTYAQNKLKLINHLFQMLFCLHYFILNFSKKFQNKYFYPQFAYENTKT